MLNRGHIYLNRGHLSVFGYYDLARLISNLHHSTYCWHSARNTTQFNSIQLSATTTTTMFNLIQSPTTTTATTSTVEYRIQWLLSHHLTLAVLILIQPLPLFNYMPKNMVTRSSNTAQSPLKSYFACDSRGKYDSRGKAVTTRECKDARSLSQRSAVV